MHIDVYATHTAISGGGAAEDTEGGGPQEWKVGGATHSGSHGRSLPQRENPRETARQKRTHSGASSRGAKVEKETSPSATTTISTGTTMRVFVDTSAWFALNDR